MQQIETFEGFADAVDKARGRINPIFCNSPLLVETELDDYFDCRFSIKVETLNPIRCFKGRGTDLLVQSRPGSDAMVCASAGNFGQGLAYAARRRDCSLTVLAAAGASALKIAAMRRLGAEVVVGGADLDDAKGRARAFADQSGYVFIEDGAEPELAIGAGTIAAELIEHGHRFDAILLPVGNGALAHGVGAYLRAQSISTKIVCVTASGAPAMARSIRTRSLVPARAADTIADGIAVREPVAFATRNVIALEPDVVEVSDHEILTAVELLLKTTSLMVEPAGAVGLAAIIADPDRWRGQRVQLVLCGGNVDPAEVFSTAAMPDAPRCLSH
ncbi:MAG: pyridoxal-phosphate dependent enzyme [Pseudomonadota bacterium]